MGQLLTEEFQDNEYRHGYSESFYDTLISAQLRALRKERGWTQEGLAEQTGTTQSAISVFENSDYSNWSIPKLREFARAFDVALVVKFVRFSEVQDEVAGFDRSAVFVPSYAEESVLTGREVIA